MDSVIDMRKPIVAIAFTMFLSCHATVAANCQQRGQSTGGGEIVGTLPGAALGASSAHKLAQALAPKSPSVQAFSRAGCLATKLVRRWAARIRLIISTTQNALETQRIGTTTSWTKPDSGYSGTVTPRRTWQAQDGWYCREYEQTVYIDGRAERATGIACREADGTWRMQNS